jgi:amidase
MPDIADLLDENDTMGLAALVAAGEVSAIELVDASISRIEVRNPVLNAVVAERFDRARTEAVELNATGPVAGVPFLVKDLECDVADLPSTRGSRLYADVIAAEDCELTARFKAAGLIILGNTNTPEFGKNASTEPLLHGPAHNPWNTGYSTGGSSGGSAAAVAGGMVTSAHANDGGGSIRIPASMCGLFGLKPTRGRTPIWPTPASFAYPVSIGHAVTRTVRDSAALLDAIAGPLPGDPFPAPPIPEAGSFLAAMQQSPGPLRIGFSTASVAGNVIHDDAIAAIERTARTLAGLGHHVEEASPQFDTAMPSHVLSTVMGVTTAMIVEERLAQLGRPMRGDDLEPVNMFLHERSLQVGAFELAKALQEIELLSRDVARFHQTYDLWLTSTLIPPVPVLGYLDTTSTEAIFTRAGKFSELTATFNITGQPAASIPAGFDANGLPIGIQLVGRHCSEALLLQVAAQLEIAAPWPRLAPWPPPTTS